MHSQFAKKLYKKYPKLYITNSISFLNYLVENVPHDTPKLKGDGIVICGGGMKYIPCLYVNISMLRHHGVKLPIQIWHMGDSEIVGNVKNVFKHLNVKWINYENYVKKNPLRVPIMGFTLKTFSILNCGFKNVMFLDADCIATRNPTFLFKTKEYKKTGLLVWADPLYHLIQRVWTGLTGMGSLKKMFPEKSPTRAGFTEIESGEMVINLEKHYRVFLLQHFIHQYRNFYFDYIFGDKHTLQMALGLLNKEFEMVDTGTALPYEGISYKWYDKKIIFEHHTDSEFKFNNIPIRSSFKNAKLHRKLLIELAKNWKLPKYPPFWNAEELIRKPNLVKNFNDKPLVY